MRRAAPLLALAVLLAGCGSTESPKRDAPFVPSKPPAGWVEERMKNAKAPPAGPGTASGRTGP